LRLAGRSTRLHLPGTIKVNKCQKRQKNECSLQLDVVRFGERVDGVVDGSPRRQADVDVHQLVGPLLDDQLEAVVTSGGGRTAGDDQPFQVPRRESNEARLGDVLAPPDVQEPEAGRLLEDALDLRVVHAVEVAAAVDGDVQFPQARESRRVNLGVNVIKLLFSVTERLGKIR
jgi:hypothetical protein